MKKKKKKKMKKQNISHRLLRSDARELIPFCDTLSLRGLLDGCVAQRWNVGLWPANFPCPALALQLMGDHLCG